MQRGTSRDKAEVSFVYLTTHVSLLHSKKTLGGVQNGGLRAPVYACVGLFIGGRQGLHRFTCVKTAWHKIHRKPYIELYCEVLRGICVDEYHREFENETFDSITRIVYLKASHASLFENVLSR